MLSTFLDRSWGSGRVNIIYTLTRDSWGCELTSETIPISIGGP